jgi:hypothetical protein
VEGGLLLRPQRLHRENALSHQLEAGVVADAVIFHLLDVPAAADAKNEPSSRQSVETGNALSRYDRVALRDQADAGADQQLFRLGRGKRERDERIVEMRVALSSMDIAAGRESSSPAGRDVCVLRHIE